MSGTDPYRNDEQSPNPDAQPTGPVPEAGAQEKATTQFPPAGDPPSGEAPAAEPPPADAPPADAPVADPQAGYQQAGYQQAGYQQAGYPGQGYPQQGYPQQGYPPQAYGYAPASPPTDDKATWALVSSIVGFILCPIVLHVVGWVLANQSLERIRNSRGTLGGEGVAKTARVLGIIGVVLYGVGALLAILFLAILIPLGVFAAGSVSEQIDLGSDTVVPVVVSDIDGVTFTHDAGDLTYDLTGVDFGGADADMAVELGAGTLVVEVPDDVTVTVDAQVGAGQIDLFGERTEGINLNKNLTSTGAGDAGTLDLDLGVTVGELEVSRG